MSVKSRTNFPSSGYRTAVIGIDPIVKMTKMKWPCRGTIQCSNGNLNKPLMHEAYTVTFVEQPNFHSFIISEDKWCHKLNAQINIQNMILPRVR